MRRTRSVVAAAVLAVTSLGIAAAPASACGGNEVCDRVNEACRAALGTYCLR